MVLQVRRKILVVADVVPLTAPVDPPGLVDGHMFGP